MKEFEPTISPEQDRDARFLRSRAFSPFAEISRRWGPVFERWVEVNYRHHKLTSVTSVRRDIKIFLRIIKEGPINEKSLGDYVKHLQDRNPVTAGRASVTINKWIREQIDDGKMSPKLKSITSIPQQPGKMTDPMTFEEYQKLLQTSPTPEMSWLYVLGFHTGMACVDCAQLRFSDIDFNKLYIKKKREKMLKKRGGVSIIPFQAGSDLHTGLMQFRRRWQKTDQIKSESDYVCRELAELSIRTLLTGRVTRHFEKCGIKGGFRKFRVAMARSLNDGSSASIVDMMRIMGHTSPATTQRYIPPDIDKLRQHTIEAAQSREEDPESIAGDIGVEHEDVPIGEGAVIPMVKEEFEAYTVWSRKDKTSSGRRRHRLYVVSPRGAFYSCDWAGLPKTLSVAPEFFRRAELKQVTVTVKEKARERITKLDVMHYGHEESISRIINFTSSDVQDSGEEGTGRGGEAAHRH